MVRHVKADAQPQPYAAHSANSEDHCLTRCALVASVAIRAGWLRVDLPASNATLPKDFVMALAFAPTNSPVPYEIKLGRSAKSFARPATLLYVRLPKGYRPAQ